MSRFTGWTMKDVERLNSNKDESNEKPKNKKYVGPDYVGMISCALTILKIDHEREYKFLHDRRFRFDLAIPAHRIAIEFEGGIFRKGRHTRGQGYANDVKKYNLAVKHGWKLHRVTCLDTRTVNWEFKVAVEIFELL